MSRLARHLFTPAAVVSGVLFAGVLVAWAASFVTFPYWQRGAWPGGTTSVSVQGHREVMISSSTPARAVPAGVPTGDAAVVRWETPFVDYLVWDMVRDTAAGRVHEVDRNLYLPLWALALLTAVLPAARLARSRRERRGRLVGLCAACGYDLRTAPARCPECGTGTPPAAAEG